MADNKIVHEHIDIKEVEKKITMNYNMSQMYS